MCKLCKYFTVDEIPLDEKELKELDYNQGYCFKCNTIISWDMYCMLFENK